MHSTCCGAGPCRHVGVPLPPEGAGGREGAKMAGGPRAEGTGAGRDGDGAMGGQRRLRRGVPEEVSSSC